MLCAYSLCKVYKARPMELIKGKHIFWVMPLVAQLQISP